MEFERDKSLRNTQVGVQASYIEERMKNAVKMALKHRGSDVLELISWTQTAIEALKRFMIGALAPRAQIHNALDNRAQLQRRKLRNK